MRETLSMVNKIYLSCWKNNNRYDIEQFPLSEFSDYWGRRLYKLLGVHTVENMEYSIYVYSVERSEYIPDETAYIARNFHAGNVIKFKLKDDLK